MKILTPLALALAVLCISSDPVVAAAKTSEASNNFSGPQGPNSLIPVAGTTSSLIAIPNLIEAGRRNEATAIPDLLEAGNGLSQPHYYQLTQPHYIEGVATDGLQHGPASYYRRADSTSDYNGDAPFGLSDRDFGDQDRGAGLWSCHFD